MSEILALLAAGDAPEYYVEIANDADSHQIIVGRFRRFNEAADYYDGLTREQPQMRVTMRHRAHVYRCYVPGRLCRGGSARG